MMPKDYEYLLVAADLAHFHKRWGFSIKIMKWKLFLEGHRFPTINCDDTFEVDVKKVDLNAFIEGESPKHMEKLNFIRIGVLHAKSPRKIEMQKDSDGLMIVTPPRLNGLRIKQQSFRQSAVAAVTAVVAAAVAAATTIATTAAVVDCYVFITPSLDFNGTGRRRRHP